MKPLIYIHINRTGGTSIEHALELPKCKHLLPQNYADDEWQRAFKFTIVRNPYDRVVSIYTWRQKTGQCPPMSFAEFVTRCWVDKDPAVRQDPRYPPEGLDPEHMRKYFEPCWWWFDARMFDFIGQFESLQDDFNLAMEYAGREKLELPHFKPTQRRKYRTYYTPITRDIITEAFRDDLEMFDYSW